MKMRKPALGAGAAALLLAGLAACSASPAQGGESGEVRFTWWGSDQRNARTNAVIDLFEESHDTVVKGEPVDWVKYWERLNVQAAGKNLPCVTSVLTFTLNDYAATGQFLDLSKQEGIDLSAVDPDVVDSLKDDDGALYMAPYGLAPDVVAYNAAMVEENGIALLPENHTWREYWDWLREAQQSLPDGVYASVAPADANGATTYLASLGPVFDGDEPTFKVGDLADWFSTWKELMDEGVVLPANRMGDYALSNEDSALAQGAVLSAGIPANALGATRRGMESHGIDGAVGYFLRPLAEDGTATDLLPVNGLAVSATCPNPDEAVSFVNFWINDEAANVAFGADNGSPVVAEYREKLLSDSSTPDSVKDVIEVADRVVTRGHASVRLPVGYQTAFVETYKRVSQAALSGDMDPKDAAQEVFDAFN
jgi:multiple sugar transport system substrate-binding protein